MPVGFNGDTVATALGSWTILSQTRSVMWKTRRQWAVWSLTLMCCATFLAPSRPWRRAAMDHWAAVSDHFKHQKLPPSWSMFGRSICTY